MYLVGLGLFIYGEIYEQITAMHLSRFFENGRGKGSYTDKQAGIWYCNLRLLLGFLF